jgi:hypothetical protein
VIRYSADGLIYFVLVTAAHVLDDVAGEKITLNYREKNPDGTYTVNPHEIAIRAGSQNLFVKHPNVDVATMHVRMPQSFADRQLVDVELLAQEHDIKRFELHAGDILRCLGFPLFASTEHWFPILRSGMIASHPLLPTEVHNNWLFDFQVFGGNSGGPVYFVDHNRRYEGTTHLGETIQLVIGLVTSQLSAALFNNQELHVGVVVPSTLIRETTALLTEPK